MLEVLIGRKVKGAPETKTSAAGNRYAQGRVLVHVEGDEYVLASVTAFGDQAGALAALSAGDGVAVAGAAFGACMAEVARRKRSSDHRPRGRAV